MTEDELDRLDTAHRRSEGSLIHYDTALCAECSEPWPCTATRLLAEVRRLRGALVAAGEANDLEEMGWIVRDALGITLPGAIR